MTARTLLEQDGGELVVRIRVEAPAVDGDGAPGGPLLITRGNVEALTGLRWRAVDDAMRRLRIARLKVGGTAAYETASALAALRADAAKRAPSAPARPPPANDDEGYRAAVVSMSARRRVR